MTRRSLRRRLALTLSAPVFATLSAGVQAADPSFADESMIIGELPRVLTASRIAQSPLDAPAPVTVIDR